MHLHRRTQDNQLVHVARVASHVRVPKPSDSTVSGRSIRRPRGACIYVCGCLDRSRKQKRGKDNNIHVRLRTPHSRHLRKTKTPRVSIVLLFNASSPRCACAGSGKKVGLYSFTVCFCVYTQIYARFSIDTHTHTYWRVRYYYVRSLGRRRLK